jgi:K+-transporting ATPase c subunit
MALPQHTHPAPQAQPPPDPILSSASSLSPHRSSASCQGPSIRHRHPASQKQPFSQKRQRMVRGAQQRINTRNIR